jgi:hypothetical protein
LLQFCFRSWLFTAALLGHWQNALAMTIGTSIQLRLTMIHIRMDRQVSTVLKILPGPLCIVHDQKCEWVRRRKAAQYNSIECFVSAASTPLPFTNQNP